ncbi:MAG TPA: class IV adenylate cyclase [Methylomirabilota bacterium]|nr:class IV adenylate cyclase [Methylomirabilota bacterium]
MTVARNVEIKARVADPAALRARVAARAAAGPVVTTQTDTFFATPRGRLKLRDFGDGSGELIFYERADVAGPRESRYTRAGCAEPAALAGLLGAALGVRGVVRKRRELFLLGRTRIHLDDVAGLGCFMEIEVVLADGEAAADGEREARALLAALEVPAAALVARAYVDLLEEGTARAALTRTSATARPAPIAARPASPSAATSPPSTRSEPS